MRRARTLIFLLLILIIGLAVAYFGIRALQQYLTPPPPPPVNVQVFVAGQNIPQGATNHGGCPRDDRGSGGQGECRRVHRGQEGPAGQQDRQVPD